MGIPRFLADRAKKSLRVRCILKRPSSDRYGCKVGLARRRHQMRIL